MNRKIDMFYTVFYFCRYYFQSEERIQMWAHCCRINAGINTNMALESLNKFLKYNLLAGNAWLQLRDSWIEEKIWNNIYNLHRPTSDNFQDRFVGTTHRQAEGNLDNYPDYCWTLQRPSRCFPQTKMCQEESHWEKEDNLVHASECNNLDNVQMVEFGKFQVVINSYEDL